MSQPLSADQLAFYREQGYLDCGRVLATSAVDELRAIIDGFVASARKENVGLSAEAGKSYTLFTPVFTVASRYEALVLQNPAILDILESILGPVFRLLEDAMFFKPANHGAALAYHHDNSYYGFPLDVPAVTCWIAIDDSTLDNGCLRFVPGSHLQDTPHEQITGTVLTRAAVDESQVIDLPVPAGTVVIFDKLTIHGSGPNTTDRPRRACNIVGVVPTVDSKLRHFDDTLNPYLRGGPAA